MSWYRLEFEENVPFPPFAGLPQSPNDGKLAFGQQMTTLVITDTPPSDTIAISFDKLVEVRTELSLDALRQTKLYLRAGSGRAPQSGSYSALATVNALFATIVCEVGTNTQLTLETDESSLVCQSTRQTSGQNAVFMYKPSEKTLELREREISVAVSDEYHEMLSLHAERETTINLVPTIHSTVLSRRPTAIRATETLSGRRGSRVEVQLSGPGSFLVSSNVSRFVCGHLQTDQESNESASDSSESSLLDLPSLTVANGARIAGASGHCRLRRFDGRIYGDEKKGFCILEVDTGNQRGRTVAGHLVNVNLNGLPLEQVQKLSSLSVFEPHARSLKRYAKENGKLARIADYVRHLGRSQPGRQRVEREELKERAQKIAEIAEHVRGRVNPGRVQTTLRWAIARLQHRSLRPFAWERVVRLFMRLLGYGYRPGVALVTWVLATAAILLLNGWLESGKGLWDNLWDLGLSLELLFSPLSLFRLGEIGNPLRLGTWAVAPTRIVIGVPLLFVVLGLRQYVRVPLRRDTSE